MGMWRRPLPYWLLAVLLFAVTSPLLRDLTSGETLWEWQLRWFNLPVLVVAIAAALFAEICSHTKSACVLASAVMFACFVVEARYILYALMYPMLWTAAGAVSASLFFVAGVMFASRSYRITRET